MLMYGLIERGKFIRTWGGRSMIANSLTFSCFVCFSHLHSSFSNLLSTPPSLPSLPFSLCKADFSALSSCLNPTSSFFSLLYYLVPYLFMSHSPKVRTVIASHCSMATSLPATINHLPPDTPCSTGASGLLIVLRCLSELSACQVQSSSFSFSSGYLAPERMA